MSGPLMTIDGEARDSADRFDVTNPATGEPFDTAPECSRAVLDEAMAGAERAFASWRTDDVARRDALRAAAKVLGEAAGEIAPILTREQGKPLGQAMVEVAMAGVWFQYYADLEVERQVVQQDDDTFVEVTRRPLGVVAAIAPWNFPIALATWKIAPALRAGNTVVVKPSPYTPLSTLKMVELLNDVLPPGVLNSVSGGNELGSQMVSHPTPRKVSFTGSVATGKKVAVAAGADIKRVTLELGGNDPAIVLDDADPEETARALFWSAFMNSGQICVAVKRVYVPERLHDRFVDALVDQAVDAVVGDGMDDGVQIGPVNNRPQLERVAGLVREAIGDGASAAAGGSVMNRPGYFFEPTILTGAADGSRIVDEEQFGPALPVVPYRDLDDAVARANATSYGLGGSVWTADASRGEEIARRLECGTAWVNTHSMLLPHIPFGGVKWSGLGLENAMCGYESFTDVQVIHRVNRMAALPG